MPGARGISSGNSVDVSGGRWVAVPDTSVELYREIKNLILANRVLPVEGYEFPQETVAGFWKDIFEAQGLRVFGFEEVPHDCKVKQADFQLPDDPPSWLIEEEC